MEREQKWIHWTQKTRALLCHKVKSISNYMITFIRWSIIAGLTGILGGVVGGVFHKAVEFATQVRQQHDFLIYFLPLGGLLIIFLYHFLRFRQDPGTNRVLAAVHSKKKVPLALGPLIFVSTVITHLLGGSAGREGAALQLGGSIGALMGRIFRLDAKNMNLIIMCGMSGVFSALFGTPITAAVFAMEVISVGVMYYSGMLPCLVSAYMAWWVSVRMGNASVCFSIPFVPVVDFKSIFQVMLLAAACAVVSIVFCMVMRHGHRLIAKILPNRYLQAFFGGSAIVALTMLLGTRDYNGAGMEIISAAVSGGEMLPYAFLLKIIFTAITIGCGFKGGEIVPTFFIGATFGSVAGTFLGLDSGFGAAVGMIAMFCGVVNCPMASMILSLEMFGGTGFVFFAVTAAVSYMLSGYYGLYSEQKIMYSKLRAEYINRNAK